MVWLRGEESRLCVLVASEAHTCCLCVLACDAVGPPLRPCHLRAGCPDDWAAASDDERCCGVCGTKSAAGYAVFHFCKCVGAVVLHVLTLVWIHVCLCFLGPPTSLCVHVCLSILVLILHNSLLLGPDCV